MSEATAAIIAEDAPVETTVADVPEALAVEGANAAGAEDAGTDTDWRTQIAGGDDKLLGFLGRFGSGKALAEAVKKHEDAIKSGKYVPMLPDNATDAEIKAYRKAVGVPEAPESYLENLDGLVIGDDDAPIVGDFAKAMHGLNAPPALVKAGIEWYYGQIEQQLSDEADRASAAKDAGTEALRDEWGADYKRNINITKALLSTAPDSVKQVFENGKGPDGLPIGSNPDVIRWLNAMALELNPTATVMPGTGTSQATAIADEIAGLEKRMETDRAAYFKDEPAQARYLQLIEARDKLQARG